MFDKRTIISVFVAVFGSIGVCDYAKALDASSREQAYLLTPKASYEYYCSPCHGPKGKGDGTFFTIDLKPKPRNFRDAEYMKKRTDDQLVKSITDGSKSVEKSNLCPPWGKTIPEKRIKEIVLHIRSFSAEAAASTQVAEKKAAVIEDVKESGFKSMVRWAFVIVITVALAGGAISEWKKLGRESK
ncbi:MAG: c-type cytochrome [Planctomycetes bacterium]|nr:c-type cytochrome [Planctomycetota bacterium]